MMTNTNKFSIGLLLALSLLMTQVGGVIAAPLLQNRIPVSGILQSIMLEADTSTGVTVVSMDLVDNDQAVQSVRVSLETAIAQGLVVLNGDGQPAINTSALGMPVEIDPASIIPFREENQHPVGSALATFFSDIPGLDYESIMAAHEQGTGFGVIAQALWLTTKLDGDAEIFEAIITARQTGDYSAFVLEDGSSPENWGQLKKAILDKGKNNGVGVVMSNSDHPGDGNGNGQGNIDNGNGNGNGNNGDKDKDKEQDKDKGPDKEKDKDKKK
jgi:hypothetical protein